MRRLAITLASAAALTMGSAFMGGATRRWNAAPLRSPGKRKTSPPLKRPPAVLIGAAFCGPVASPGLRPLALLVRPLLSA